MAPRSRAATSFPSPTACKVVSTPRQASESGDRSTKSACDGREGVAFARQTLCGCVVVWGKAAGGGRKAEGIMRANDSAILPTTQLAGALATSHACQNTTRIRCSACLVLYAGN
jgi:hypothetical protein